MLVSKKSSTDPQYPPESKNLHFLDFGSSEQALAIAGEGRVLIDTMRKRQRKWIGCIHRGDLMLKTVIEGKIEGMKRSGIPRQLIRWGWVGWWQTVIESWKKRNNSNRQHLNLPKRQEPEQVVHLHVFQEQYFWLHQCNIDQLLWLRYCNEITRLTCSRSVTDRKIKCIWD